MHRTCRCSLTRTPKVATRWVYRVVRTPLDSPGLFLPGARPTLVGDFLFLLSRVVLLGNHIPSSGDRGGPGCLRRPGPGWSSVYTSPSLPARSSTPNPAIPHSPASRPPAHRVTRKCFIITLRQSRLPGWSLSGPTTSVS